MVYSWRDVEWEIEMRKANNLPLDVLPIVEKGTWEGSQLEWQFKIESGLSSFASDVHGLRSYLDELFTQVYTIIPSSAYALTPIYIFATAGMRLLPPAARKSILQDTCSYLQKLPFFVQQGNKGAEEDTDSACGGQVRVISGEEEGLFGWIAINYLMDGFKDPSVGNATFGFLDMGGASTQIAFEPSQTIASPHAMDEEHIDVPKNNDLFDVNFRRLDSSLSNHQVFVTTFLGFGTNAARTRYLDVLLDTVAPNQALLDPCLPKGLRMPVASAAHQGKHVQGTGSFSECLLQQQPLLDREAECHNPPCLFHGVHVPAIDFDSNQFIGVSEYWYSSHDIFDLGGSYDYTKYQQAAQAFCAQEWSDLETKLDQHAFKEQVTLSRLQMQCFKAAWVVTVLHEGLQLPRLVDKGIGGDGQDHAHDVKNMASKKNLFQSVNDVRGLGVSWTLGKAILEASTSIPATSCQDCHLRVQHNEPHTYKGARLGGVEAGRAGVPVWVSMLLLALCILAMYGVWRFAKRSALDYRGWTSVPMSETCRDDDDAVVPLVLEEQEPWSDIRPVKTPTYARAVQSHSHRSSHHARRKSAFHKERGHFASMAHKTAEYASRQLSRVFPDRRQGKFEELPTAHSLARRSYPTPLRTQRLESLSQQGLLSISTPWSSSFRTPVHPVSPSPLSPTAVSYSHPASPAVWPDSPSTPAHRTGNDASALLASGSAYSNHTPSRGPSPMLLESRRPSVPFTAPVTRMSSPWLELPNRSAEPSPTASLFPHKRLYE
ncbi:Ynd1p [Malassezia vespertilionis]|uniref:Ynd1p n=2 Tax=Malassezia vespertilionis TaxID=2020962 RepID=A0A2N1JD41_9BASI|nr:Ynd1p [Malassezia vespertilionis]